MDELFGALEGNETSRMEILSEMFDVNNPQAKTQLNAKQIQVITRIELLALMYPDNQNLQNLKKLCEKFMVMMYSYGRESRKEAVKGIVSAPDEEKQEKVLK